MPDPAPSSRPVTGLYGPVPPQPPIPTAHIPVWEGLRLTVAGLRDRVRCRRVPDMELTHFLHKVHASTRGIQANQNHWCTAVDGYLNIEIASAREVSARSVEIAPAAKAQDLAELSGRDRHHWAQAQREHAASAAEQTHSQAERQESQRRLARLEAERREIRELQADLADLCAAHFAARAARYTRARTGLLGLQPAGIPEIPSYLPLSAAGGALPFD